MKRTSLRPALDRAASVAAALVAVGSGVALVASLKAPDQPPLAGAALALVMIGALALAGVVAMRARAVRLQNEQIHRQERILHAAAFAADRFVGDDSLNDALPEVLERIGRATSSSRIYLFENSRDRQGQTLMSIRQEWCAEGVQPTLDDAANQRFPYTAGYMHWFRKLRDGLPVQVRLSDTSGTEREDMEAEGSLSVAIVPVYVAGEWWGFLGVDDCERDREWSSGELEALTVAAATYGAAVARERWTTELAAAEERFRVLVEQAPAVVYIDALDEVAATIYVSPQIETMTGYTAEEWTRDPELWVRLIHDDDRPEALAQQTHHNETGDPFRMEYRLSTKTGREIWVRDEAVVIRNEDGSFRHSQGVMQDITDLRNVEDRIQDLATRDGLTQLPNLTMFTQLSGAAFARAQHSDQAVAIVAVDVDGFKLANDSLGTEGGDELLKQIASRIGMTLADTDTLGRRGADDFLILLADLDRGSVGDLQTPILFAESVAARIRDSLKQPFFVREREVFVSASAGISVYPDDAEDVESLLLHAEHAMRASKREGPGGFAAYGSTAYDSAATFAFITKLRRAVERREWLLLYQPIVELGTGAVHGVEALLRWSGDESEQISPAEFIPVAEELGLIEDIGDWVVEELVHQEKRWRGEGMKLEMGFNLSPRQFWQPDLAQRIFAKLEEQNVDPSTIMVEITETSAMRDPERANAVLWDLHQRGLKLALDDFGTGYSSLSRLRNLPVDVLKIDRSFVTGVDLDPQSAKIVAAFIQLGQGLGMTTLAEGIETEGEWRFLAEHGCELGQGFYFARPLQAREISRRWHAGEMVLTSGAAPPQTEPSKREVARVWRPGAAAGGRG